MLELINNVEGAAQPRGHYSQAVVCNGLVYVSGQLGIEPISQSTVVGTIEEQAKNILTSVQSILNFAGTNLDRVIKINIYLSNIEDWDSVNKVYSHFFAHHKPARIVIPTGNKFHLNFDMAMDVIASL